MIALENKLKPTNIPAKGSLSNGIVKAGFLQRINKKETFQIRRRARDKNQLTIIPRGELFWTKIFDTKIYSIGLGAKSSHARCRFAQVENKKVQIENYVISS